MNPNDGRVVINFIMQALKNDPLTIYGNGLQTRGFCYVTDLIQGTTKYADSHLTFSINLGNDAEFNMLELAKIVIDIIKPNSKVFF